MSEHVETAVNIAGDLTPVSTVICYKPKQHGDGTASSLSVWGESENSRPSRKDAQPQFKLKESESTCSIFNEAACGEPLRSQRLIIDFTPRGDDHNPALQKRISDFFAYVNSREDLNALIKLPVPIEEDEEEETCTSGVSPETSTSSERIPIERTAVSMLEIVEQQDLINRAFDTKMPPECVAELDEYGVDDNYGPKKPPTQPCSCVTTCSNCRRRKEEATKTPAGTNLTNMVWNMERWDVTHQKSMLPPVGPPTLIHAELQRLKPKDYPVYVCDECSPKPPPADDDEDLMK